MVGLPARYVVGYAAPQSLFTAAGDGSCRAVLQDDNAHAWAEIYLSGQGWTPLEVTPGMTAELTEGELAADAAQAGQNAADSDTPLPARQEADSPAETPQSVPLLLGAAYGFAAARLGLGTSAPCKAHTFADRTGRILCAPSQDAGAAGWRRRCPLTKRHLRNFCKRIARRRTAKPCSTCWMPYRRHSLRPIHAPPKPRRRYRPCAVNYAKNCADERCEGCARGSFTQEIIDDSAKTIMIIVNTYRR